MRKLSKSGSGDGGFIDLKLCILYPGLFAIAVYRMAHVLHGLEVPLALETNPCHSPMKRSFPQKTNSPALSPVQAKLIFSFSPNSTANAVGRDMLSKIESPARPAF